MRKGREQELRCYTGSQRKNATTPLWLYLTQGGKETMTRAVSLPGLPASRRLHHNHPQQCPRPAPLPPLHLHLLEAPHAVQDVKLLPALGEVYFAVNVIWVSQMNKGQVLQNQASEREKGAAGQGLGKQVEVFVTHGQESGQKQPHTT